MEKAKIQELIDTAIAQLSYSYTPYSHFKVGAALLGKNGQIYTGCNIENAAYTPTNCAERTAFAKAISEGYHTFSALAIVGGPEDQVPPLAKFCTPCGVCRQWLAEFCVKSMPVILACSHTDYRIFTCEELIPHCFSLPIVVE